MSKKVVISCRVLCCHLGDHLLHRPGNRPQHLSGGWFPSAINACSPMKPSVAHHVIIRIEVTA
jgi:hypothetical protein